MLAAFRFMVVALEGALALPIKVLHFLTYSVMLNPRLGPLRHLFTIAFFYAVFAVLLVYVVAPIRGLAGDIWNGEKLRYDSERWLGTAIYDRKGHFVGTFDARLDSQRDVNYTGVPIEDPATGYVANPDHKSIPVKVVPEWYWRCLVYHEDRRLGTWLNPFGIDLLGVLKIPFSTIERSIRARSLHFGVGGSTLPMQLARIVRKTPPRLDESVLEKIDRKLSEWWLAPVIYRALTKDGNMRPLKEWAANHLWLAQRAGGGDLYGVEMAARVIFAKPASALSIAEQFVLASAVNRPIILLEGSERLNDVRIDRWRYVVDVRARKCASALIRDSETQKEVWFELTRIAHGPPDPKVRPELERTLERYGPRLAMRARANPALRANILIPAARYGAREEMKAEYGHGWRQYVRGVELTFDVTENRRFRDAVIKRLAKLQERWAAQIDPDFSLDVGAVRSGAGPRKMVPDVTIVAANARGEIVRYFEATETAPYFGSPSARNTETGGYEPERESRAIASIGKMIAAIAIANEGRDTLDTLYVDDQAPERGLESCRRGGKLRRGRKARVAFACSLNRPIEWRLAKFSQRRLGRLAQRLGFNMPPAPSPAERTPPSTAIVRGMITASPRKVHQLAGLVLASLTGRSRAPVPLPSLIRSWDRSELTNKDRANGDGDGDKGPRSEGATSDLVPARFIRPRARKMLAAFLSRPLCYQYRGRRHGTLKRLARWCAERRRDIRLHFAKTGTQVTRDPDATVDAWIAGGIQFANGAAYSYVVLVGTGNSQRPWARKLHAAQVAAPLLEVLLEDLAKKARKRPAGAKRSARPERPAHSKRPARPKRPAVAAARPGRT